MITGRCTAPSRSSSGCGRALWKSSSMDPPGPSRPSWPVAAEVTVEMLPGNEFTRVIDADPADPAPDACRAALCRWSAPAATAGARSTPGRTAGAMRTGSRCSPGRAAAAGLGVDPRRAARPRSRCARTAAGARRRRCTTCAAAQPGTGRATSGRCATRATRRSPAGRAARRGRDPCGSHAAAALPVSIWPGRNLGRRAARNGETWVGKRALRRVRQHAGLEGLCPTPRERGARGSQIDRERASRAPHALTRASALSCRTVVLSLRACRLVCGQNRHCARVLRAGCRAGCAGSCGCAPPSADDVEACCARGRVRGRSGQRRAGPG